MNRQLEAIIQILQSNESLSQANKDLIQANLDQIRDYIPPDVNLVLSAINSVGSSRKMQQSAKYEAFNFLPQFLKIN